MRVTSELINEYDSEIVAEGCAFQLVVVVVIIIIIIFIKY